MKVDTTLKIDAIISQHRMRTGHGLIVVYWLPCNIVGVVGGIIHNCVDQDTGVGTSGAPGSGPGHVTTLT